MCPRVSIFIETRKIPHNLCVKVVGGGPPTVSRGWCVGVAGERGGRWERAAG